MELTLSYILSQILIAAYFISLMPTYFVKNRKTMLIISVLGLVCCSTSYALLGAWAGFAMTFISMLRNMIFLIDEQKNGKSNMR